MSFQEIEGLSKADLKNKLSQMGMSLYRDDRPRDYYVQLYLEKSNAKNKITRDNTPFYNNKILRRKRQRQRIKEKETHKDLNDDPNYEEEEYEEEEEINDEDEDAIKEEELEEKSEEEEKGKNLSKRKNKKKVKIDEKTNDYRESGIKIIKLIRKKKEKNLNIKNILDKNDIQQSNVRRKILNNFNELGGQNDIYEKNNTENYLIGENSQNQNINNIQDYNSKNNEFYNFKNKTNFPETKVENLNNKEENQINNKDNNIYQILNEDIKQKNNIISFGKESQNSSEAKKIILQWETPRQKEFLYSSMEKEKTFKRPSDEEMNNVNKANLQREFEIKDNDNNYNNQKRGQIVSDSINNTTICQNVKNNYNMNNLNDNSNNKDNKEFIINYNQENGDENINVNDINKNNNNYDYKMNNNNYENEFEMKDNSDMKNLVNDEADNNEINNKSELSGQEFENSETKKLNRNCQIF